MSFHIICAFSIFDSLANIALGDLSDILTWSRITLTLQTRTYYKAYIDAIRVQLIKYSDLRILLVVEPDSLANMVTNLNVAKCANAQATYLAGVQYAIQQLNLANVAMYLDAGHAGWLGWAANLQPAATLFAKVYSDAGKPAAVRGLATNVANYNAWTVSPAPSYTSGQSKPETRGCAYTDVASTRGL